MKFAHITDPHFTSVAPSSRIDNFVEASFAKFEWVLQRCVDEKADALLITGDLFSTPTQIDQIKNRLKALILKYGVRVISIPGNHDLLHYNVGYIDRTSYMAMASPEVMIDLSGQPEGEYHIGDWIIKMHPFGEAFPMVNIKNTIILSHCFYNYDKEDRLSVHRQHVYKCGAKFVLFGHDHNQYQVEDNNGTLVVRPGALTRGTSHTENRVRVVSMAWIDTDKGEAWYEPIAGVLKFDDVFKINYDVAKEKTVVTFDEIQKFIDDLRNAKSSVNPYDILLAMEKPPEIVRRCSYYLTKVGIIN